MPLFSIILIGFALLTTVAAQETRLSVRFFDEGTRAAQSEQFEKAIESYQKALLQAKNEETNRDLLVRIHSNIGVCLYQLKRQESAIAEFSEAVRLSKGKYQKAFYALGMANADLENRDAARAAFLQAVKLKKDDGEAWFDLALIFIADKDLTAAEKAFRKSIKYKSVAKAYAHNNLGVIFALQGDLAAAENEFVTALNESNGESVEARRNLQFCKLYKQNINRKPVANLEIADRRGSKRQI
jgi:tetratricopeptide (TPR) repeat protein